MNDILQKLVPIFKKVFGEHTVITYTTRQEEIPEWDSINHLYMVLELEDAFQLGLLPEEIETLKSVEDVVNAIRKRKN
ncbi:MAG: acyl carrier protein [Bacteroidetes bacterium]|nr:acyl carrier protein [Bacteroidota bacterium]